jgi:hypothetical protein
MTKRIKRFVGFRHIGLLAVALLGVASIIGSNGDGRGSNDKYMRNARVINEAPPPETVSPSTPAVFDLALLSPGGAGLSVSVSFTDIEGDVTTFCIAFDDQPDKYYAYDVKKDTYGQTSYRLSVTDMININDIGTYCFTVFVQDEAGHTSNKLSACFAVKCEPYDDECDAGCDDGTMTIIGTIDGDSINLSGYVCAEKDDDLAIGLFCGEIQIGLIIKEPDKLAAGTTFAVKPYQGDQVMPDDFPIVVERYQPDHWKESASGGTFTVITYNANGLNATYDLLMPDGGHVSGEINLWNF